MHTAATSGRYAASMVKVIRNIAIALAAIAAIAVAFCLFTGSLPGSSNNSSSTSPLDELKTSTVNAAIDASGIKTRVESALYNEAESIASATDLSAQQVRTGIENLSIDEWTAVSSAAGASETGSYNISAGGVDATITTYDDPQYLTVNAYGQSVTFRVPDGAQSYESYLEYFGR